MKSETTFILGLLVVLLVGVSFSQLFFETRKSATNEISINHLQSYTESYPTVTGSFIGDSNAQIEIIAFFDSSMDVSQFSAYLKELNTEYIETKRARLYLRPILSMEDTRKKNTRYEFTSTFYCEGVSSVDELEPLLYEDEQGCTSKHEDLLPHAAEIEHLGLHGINTRFYIGLGNNYDVIEGVPSRQRLERSIRLKEITLGI